eukprot:5421448-Prymnesium_polylepis.1
MRVVRIVDLEAGLVSTPPDRLLSELVSSETLLSWATAGTRTALVSYRQERACGDPSLTLDGAALLGAIAAAKRGGIEALWLDVWCYRFVKYDHDDFCKTLSNVLSQVKAVVWLQRSKAAATGTYGYRLWCTFEAACVKQLQLPVLIAGHKLSSRQKALAKYGSFAASVGFLDRDGVTDRLCRFNLAYYIAIGSIAVSTVIQVIRCRETCQVEALASEHKAMQDELPRGLLFLLLISVGWIAIRHQGSLSQELQLAKNAKRVMRVMLDLPLKRRHDAQAMLKALPWLPAHDRRDVMVVQHLLAETAPECALSASNVYALALSSYAAASCAPGLGDGTPRAQTIGEWLLERDIVITVAGARSSHFQQSSGTDMPQ